MNQFVIDADLAQAIGDYLIERPFKEVAGLVSRLTQIKPLTVTDTETTKTDYVPESE